MELIFYGRGGQGAVTAASLLVQAADYEGKFAQAHPFFGFERRGAPVSAFLRIDDKPILARGRIQYPDCIVVLDPKLPELIDVTVGLKNGAMAVLNFTKEAQRLAVFAKVSKIGLVDANAIATEIFGPAAIASTNTIMLGALSATTGWIRLESILEAVKKKFRGPVLAKNEIAIQMGYERTMVVKGGAR